MMYSITVSICAPGIRITLLICSNISHCLVVFYIISFVDEYPNSIGTEIPKQFIVYYLFHIIHIWNYFSILPTLFTRIHKVDNVRNWELQFMHAAHTTISKPTKLTI